MSENKNAKTSADGGAGFNYFRASAITVLRQAQEENPPKREWVGLTDEEVNELVARFKRYAYVLLREVEAKLKEKNKW